MILILATLVVIGVALMAAIKRVEGKIDALTLKVDKPT